MQETWFLINLHSCWLERFIAIQELKFGMSCIWKIRRSVKEILTIAQILWDHKSAILPLTTTLQTTI